MPAIEVLVAAVGGDLEDLREEQFVVAAEDRSILGCGRLRPHPDCWELASLAVAAEAQARGIGGSVVKSLLEPHQGPIYLVCEDQVVGFFSRFGFRVIPTSQIPAGLRSKWHRYRAQAMPLNLMLRE
jgi:N-acetylglutamate synthase-like GNAT family acetyltransferase